MSITNRFTDKMKEKTILELEQIVSNRDHYQKDAYTAALNELKIRESQQDASGAIENINEIHEVIKNEEKIEKRINSSKWSWLSKKHFLDHLNLYSLVGLISVISMMPDMNGYYLFILYISIPLISFWQINIESIKSFRRSHYFQIRLIYSFYLTLLIFLRHYVTDSGSEPTSTWISVFAIFLVTSGLISLIPYLITLKRFIKPKYYFLRQTRLFIPVSLVIYFLLFVQEERWFFKDSKVQWEGENPIGIDHFRGYPDFFTKYDAAIRSFLDYEFDNDDNLNFLNAVSNPRYCWINPWDRDEYFLLQHERYHFNITEVVARKTRKRILDTLRLGGDRNGIELIIKRAKSELGKLQSQYDLETDHSTISDKQSYWQFHIDSLLAEYDPYWSSSVLEESSKPDSIKYFRDYTFKDFDKIIPVDLIMSNEEKYTSCLEVTYDSMNRITQMRYLFQGAPSQESYLGFSVVKIDYSKELETWKFYDEEGNPVVIDYGYHEIGYVYDGNTVEISHWDKESDPIKRDGKDHLTRILYKNKDEWEEKFYDENGNRIGLENNIYYHKLRFNKGTVKHYRDTLLFKIRERFDRNGNPVNNSNGSHRTILGRDKEGRLVYSASMDVNGKYVKDEEVFIEIRRYDDLGNFQSIEYYNENFDRMENENGVFRKTWSSDRYGNTNRRSTYNANNRLIEVDGEASFYKKYDSRNNMVMYAGYDSGDKLVFDKNSYGKVLYYYDSMGRNYKIINQNGYDYPINSDISSAVQTYEFDSMRRVISGRNFDKDMTAVQDYRGVHRYTNVFDFNGNLIESKYFDLNNDLVPSVEDVAIFRFKYDERNNKIESRFYNEFDMLAKANQGVAINRYVFDEKNRTIERSYYDSLEQLALFDGVAKVKWKYDRNGRKIEERYYDINDSLMQDVALAYWEYNDLGKMTLQKQISADGTDVLGSIPITKFSYDNSGNRIKESYYRLSGQPTIDERLIHSYEIDYQDNYVIEIRYYDILNNLVEDQGGTAGYTNTFDQRGNIAKQSFFGSDGQLTTDTTGVSITKYSYDLSDRIMMESYFDSNDSLVNKYNLFSRLYRELNRSGDYVIECYYDNSGNLTSNRKGNALIFASYNRNGQRTENSYPLDNAIEFLETSETYNYLMNYKNTIPE